jgi:hypothetical protein
MDMILGMFQVCLFRDNFLPHELATPDHFLVNVLLSGNLKRRVFANAKQVTL